MDPKMHARNLCGDLRLKPKPVFFNANGLDDRPFECFVAGLHIRDLLMSEQIGECRQRTVCQPVHKIAFSSLMQKAGAVNNGTFAFKDRTDDLWIICRVIFQISILNDADIAGGCRKTRAERTAFALILFMVNDLIGQRPHIFFQDLAGSVGGAVVHNDDLFILNRCFLHFLNQREDAAFFVIAWNDNG